MDPKRFGILQLEGSLPLYQYQLLSGPLPVNLRKAMYIPYVSYAIAMATVETAIAKARQKYATIKLEV